MPNFTNQWPTLRIVNSALGVALLLCGGCAERPPREAKVPTTEVEPLSNQKTNIETASSKTPKKTAAPPMRKAEPGDWFDDVTDSSGVRFTYQSGRSGGMFTVLESVGGGVAAFDYDRDGDIDLFFTGGGKISAAPPLVSGLPCALFRNEGECKFSDVTAECGLDDSGDYSHGCTVGDYDRDGFPDLFVTCYGHSRLYHNEQGRRFRDVTQQAGLDFDSWSTAAAWVDLDNDGWLDLYVSGYLDWKLDPSERCGDLQHGIRDVCPPQRYAASRERVFHNVGGSSFTDITKDSGLLDSAIGLGVVAADLNQDGKMDLYVANDVRRNYLYLGTDSGKLRETAIPAGTAFNEFGAPEGSMGVDVGDFDGDGDLDLFVANYQLEFNSLYRNEESDAYSHATVQAGLAGARTLVKFGTGFADFDSDGWLDLFVTNGHVLYETGVSPYEQPPLLYRNQEGVFQDVTAAGAPYFTTVHAGRGAAVGDLDNDGALDLVIVHQDKPATLLRNRKPPQHWLGVQLVGAKSNIDAVGAMATIEYEGRILVRIVRGGGGYLSHFDSRLVYPLASEEPASLLVRWPGGRQERFTQLAGNRYHRLVEGEGEPQE